MAIIELAVVLRGVGPVYTGDGAGINGVLD